MRLVFMGTPEFAVPCLQTLQENGYEIVGVFTQPDRPAGRGNKLKESPIKTLADSLKLPVYQPEKIKTPEAIEVLKNLQPECIVVVAYGQILSKEILGIPPLGCVNVHASLLPHYRGAAPIHWAVSNGETKTGITTMLMDEGLDTGDMLLKVEYEIAEDATTGEVHDALSHLGADLLILTIRGLEKGKIKPLPQPKEFSYAPLLKREHEQIEWSWEANKIHNRIRGLNPWPGAFTFFRNEQVKVWQSSIMQTEVNGSDKIQGEVAGQIISLTERGLAVLTGKGMVEIIEIQPAGKKRMSSRDFFNGRRGELGEIFGNSPRSIIEAT